MVAGDGGGVILEPLLLHSPWLAGMVVERAEPPGPGDMIESGIDMSLCG